MGTVFIRDPSLGVDCASSVVKGTNGRYGPATFKYTIVNDSDQEVFVSMVATLSVATDPPASMTNQDLNRLIAPHTSFQKPEFTLFGFRVFDESGLVTVTAAITFSLFPSGVVIFTDQTNCQLSVVDVE
jgi:hypothetical protein